MYLLLLIIIALLFVLSLVSAYENRHFVVRKYSVINEKIPEAFSGFRIAVISDLHNQEFSKGNIRLLEEINRQKPDIILCAGDILVGKPKADMKVAVKLVSDFAKRYPVYMAMGNHEYRLKLYPETYGDMWQQYFEQTDIKGVTWLDNETTYLKKNGQTIAITGLSIDAKYYHRGRLVPMKADEITKLCPFEDRQVFQVLMAHNPVYFPVYAEYGADLVISGHVHGGMVNIPPFGGMISPMIRMFPRYDQGEFHEKRSTMLLSAGLGNHTIKLRLNNPPELMMVELTKGG